MKTENKFKKNKEIKYTMQPIESAQNHNNQNMGLTHYVSIESATNSKE